METRRDSMHMVVIEQKAFAIPISDTLLDYKGNQSE